MVIKPVDGLCLKMIIDNYIHLNNAQLLCFGLHKQSTSDKLQLLVFITCITLSYKFTFHRTPHLFPVSKLFNENPYKKGYVQSPVDYLHPSVSMLLLKKNHSATTLGLDMGHASTGWASKISYYADVVNVKKLLHYTLIVYCISKYNSLLISTKTYHRCVEINQ